MTLRVSLLLLPLLAGCPSTPVADHPPHPTDDVPGADAPSDAPDPAEPCTTVGETRVGPCGRMCGQASQRCSETHVWENTSACLMEGECPRGTSEMRPVGMCGEETRLCQNDCTWTAWERSRPDGGECRPGQLRFTVDEERCGAGRGIYEVCSDACTFGPGSGTCTDGCDDSARTEPEWAREVCVPAGTFIRGWNDPEGLDLAAGPETTVYVSPYYIDVYPVTNGRYRECVTASACPADDTFFPLFDFTREDYPLNSTSRPAFCEWDGGRRLPTEAEWEKAFRGPTPRRNLTPWGPFENRCDLFVSVECGYTDPAPTVWYDDPFDALPETRGYFGTFMQYGSGLEWTSDVFDSDYYSDPSSRYDPAGPETGDLGRTVRGMYPRRDGRITSRGPGEPGAVVGMRCARTVTVGGL